MGNGESVEEAYPFSITDRMKSEIDTDQWHQTVVQSHGADIEDIDFSAEILNPFQHKYCIKISSSIPYNCKMAILFPYLDNYRQQLLWTSGDLNTMNRELNRRLRESARELYQMVTVAHDKYYRFVRFSGTMYLLWAERINRQTINRQENDIFVNVPIVVEMNGYHQMRNCFIFGGQLTHLSYCQFHEPSEESVFCCEKDPRKLSIAMVPTISNDESDAVTTNKVVRTVVTLDKEPMPFGDETMVTPAVIYPTTDRLVRFTGTNPEQLDEEP